MKSKSLPRIIKYSSLILIAFLSLAALVSNAQSWSLSGNNGTTTSNFLGTKDQKPIVFKTNNIERMRITKTGEIGIGTTAPSYPLTVNASANHGIDVRVTASGNYYYTGVYSYSVISPGFGIGIQAFGGTTGISGEAQGGSYQGAVYGVIGRGVGAAGVGTRYGVYGYALGGATNYAVYGSSSAGTNNYAGFFAGDVYVGTLFQSSDRKLKTDINPLKNSLEQLMQLKPSTYKYKNTEYSQMALSDTKQMGLIADEVKQVFPELVKEQLQPAEYDKEGTKVIRPEVKFDGINYIGFVPMLIASIQEQQKTIQDQQETILDLNAENEVLKSRLDKIEQIINSQQRTSVSKTALLSTAQLEQNAPNPFNQNTSIKYFLPQNISNAIIKITDAKGRVLKTFSIGSGKGQLNLQAGQLTAGTYQYSLIVDGKSIDTKKMVVLR
jgi:hypothetical protein